MKLALRYPSIRLGVENTAQPDVARLAHRDGHATVVPAGGFVDAAFAGRHRVAPGDVILHAAFDRHCNYSATGGATRILRLLRRYGGVMRLHIRRNGCRAAFVAAHGNARVDRWLRNPVFSGTCWVGQSASD